MTLRVIGSDDLLRAALADDITDFLKARDGVKDVDRDDKSSKDEMAIQLDYERLARYGLTVADIAQNVRIAYDGEAVTSVRYGEEDVDFRVIIEKSSRQRLDYLRQLRIPNRSGELIALDEIAKFDIGPGTAVIHHYEGERSVTIDAEVVRYETTPTEVTKAVLAHVNLDRDYPGIRIKVGGEAQETQSSLIELALTLLLAALGIYFLLMLLFNSVVQPTIGDSLDPFRKSAA